MRYLMIILWSLWGLLLFSMALGMVRQSLVAAAQIILKMYLEEKKKFIKELESEHDRLSSFNTSAYH